MREIKFRGKAINRDPDREYRTNYQNGDWIYGLVERLFNEKYNFPAKMSNTDGVTGIEVDYNTLGQYTGLKDKNGKEIYEGDIIQTYDPDEGYAVVRYDETETEFYTLFVSENSYYGLGRDFHSEDIEVISNIHDNPELLGGSEK